MVDFLSTWAFFLAIFQGRVSVPCRLIQTLCFCNCVSVDRTLTVWGSIGNRLIEINNSSGADFAGDLIMAKEMIGAWEIVQDV